MKRFGLQLKYEVTIEEIGVSSANMGIYDEMRECPMVSNENPGSLINSLGFPMNIWGFYSDDNIFPRSNFFLTNSFLTVCNIGQEFSKQVITNLAISVKPMGLTQLI